ncbi:MAG TPA: hypothetical protein PK079_23355 [Leptospiraceae bacterium]|nr:hypothetical protein [Leptospiraceae bacterium]HMW06536.1 hypothetical protein [Leptospiraceae bacterium]HMX35290.1 hypothetical protein [Leptospiraceae bacterium]HMY32826.1 hypothetical protein [Leptospiraceae bacterium]HMZ65321.1 hypothetical protein [Leptospiraceae bacterium]
MIDFAKVPDIDPDIHPIGNYRKITQWMVDFCEGDFVEAILLSFFVAMYHNQRKYFLEAIRKNQIFKQYGLTKKESESIELIYSYRQISGYIFNATKKYEVLKARIDSLAARGVITIKKALTVRDKQLLGIDTRLSTDRTNVYLFHPTPLIEYLQPYLNLQNDHDNEIQNSINLLEGKGILQKTKDGYFLPFQNKKTSGATSHLKKFQTQQAAIAPAKDKADIIADLKKHSKKNFSAVTNERILKSKILIQNEKIIITIGEYGMSVSDKKTIEKYFSELEETKSFKVVFEDNDN